MFNWLDPWRDFHRLRKLSRRERRLVVYCEGREYDVFFAPILAALTDRYRFDYLFVTSDSGDPLLGAQPPRRSFCIGHGTARTAWFQTLAADLVLMSTPDLNRFHLKRSPAVGHYAYLHHSLVSTHMAYRPGAFDNYDSILCVGPHHVTESRAWEAQHNLRAKQLVPHGYGPIDALMASAEERRTPVPDQPTVLVAPSWGQAGLIQSCGAAVCSALLQAGMRVVLRPHPRTLQTQRALVDELTARFGADDNFALDLGVASHEIYRDADIMISDWSGAAFEFAFGLLRPVLFVDVPRKVNNPHYASLDCEPLEVFLRTEVGEVVPADAPTAVVAAVERLLGHAERWRERLAAQRRQWIFNAGTSGVAGAEFIAGKLGLVARAHRGSGGAASDRSLDKRVIELLVAERGAVERILIALLTRQVGKWRKADWAALHQLAHQVEVTKRVHSTYDEAWRVPAAPTPLDSDAWPALVLVFLIAAEPAGVQCKFLSAALRALDCMEANGVKKFSRELRVRCQELLERIAP
ncbi:MAG: hypothetical protein FJ145_26000 [Deltaproteobacteria bacterium]|nr:hypothetical protein [Deltaproteobacteria bacterium]